MYIRNEGEGIVKKAVTSWVLMNKFLNKLSRLQMSKVERMSAILYPLIIPGNQIPKRKWSKGGGGLFKSVEMAKLAETKVAASLFCPRFLIAFQPVSNSSFLSIFS